MPKNNVFLGFFSLLLVIVLALMGCGGGSAGTGTGVTSDRVVVVQGAVVDESGEPVEDANVQVVETGEETTTSSGGEFQIVTSPETDSVTLEVSSETGAASIIVAIPAESGTVSVTLTVNPRLTEIDASSLEVGSGIVGRCDIYFENNAVIRQANRVPGDLRCVARVTVAADKQRLADVPIAIQYRDCGENLPWTTIAVGSTMRQPNLGVGQVEFPYIDDETRCVYRIVAPFGVPGLPDIERIIHTRTYQRQR